MAEVHTVEGTHRDATPIALPLDIFQTRDLH
jgi:hypothetical protein